MKSTTLFPGYSSYRPLKRVRRHSSLAPGDGQIRDPGNEVAKSTRLFVWEFPPPVEGGGQFITFTVSQACMHYGYHI